MFGVPANNAPGGNQIYGNPRADEVNLNKLNGLGVHNGVPQHFFNQTFHKAFKSKLADKTQDGYTMVSVENGTHMGGVQWHLSNNALPAVPNALLRSSRRSSCWSSVSAYYECCGDSVF